MRDPCAIVVGRRINANQPNILVLSTNSHASKRQTRLPNKSCISRPISPHGTEHYPAEPNPEQRRESLPPTIQTFQKHKHEPARKRKTPRPVHQRAQSTQTRTNPKTPKVPIASQNKRTEASTTPITTKPQPESPNDNEHERNRHQNTHTAQHHKTPKHEQR